MMKFEQVGYVAPGREPIIPLEELKPLEHDGVRPKPFSTGYGIFRLVAIVED